MSSVYDLTVAARALAAVAVDTDDANLDALDLRVAEWVGAAANKGEACAAAHRALTSEAEHWRAEASRLLTLAKRADRSASRVHDIATQLVMAAEGLGGEGVRVGPLRMQRNPPSVVIDVPDALPESMWLVKREPNRTAIKAAIAAGNEIPGAHLTTTRSIRGLT